MITDPTLPPFARCSNRVSLPSSIFSAFPKVTSIGILPMPESIKAIIFFPKFSPGTAIAASAALRRVVVMP